MLTLSKLNDVEPLHTANDCLDDPARLKARWDEDGYLFFRGVLDQDAVARAQAGCVKALVDMGVVDPGATEPVWNGRSLDGFPFKIPALERSRIWQDFVAAPPIKDFVARVLGEEAYFLPMTEYRVTPPEPENDDNVLMFRHQDQLLNAGIPFLVCWVPLSTIDRRAGGLAVAEGWHKRGFVHDPDDYPRFEIGIDTIPDEAWRRSDCRPGDVLFFSRMVPHSGVRNFSDRFRVSLDIRVMRASDHRPIVGQITAVGSDTVTVEDAHGGRVTLKVDEDSVVRDPKGKKLASNKALQAELTVGTQAVVAYESGVVRLIRPQR